MGRHNKQWYKIRERHCTVALFKTVGTQWELWDIDAYNRVDGRFWSPRMSGVFESVVREFSITEYERHILERWKIEGLYRYYHAHPALYFINFFPNKDLKETYDCIVYNIKPRIDRWLEGGVIPYVQSPFNRATFQSRETKEIKDVVYLKYDKTIDMRVVGVHVGGYNK